MFRKLSVALAAVALLLPFTGGAVERRTVIVLLFDGWAPAMVDAFPTPTLDRIRGEGSWTHNVVPVFPSISLPNQISVSTGCYPENHGIVTNRFRDPDRGEYDHSHDADWLNGCEHLHQVAERQGLRAAAFGWVGRKSGTRGALASTISDEKSFADFPDDSARAGQVIGQLRLPAEKRPRLILGYFRGPDGAGHFTGMESDKTRAAVESSDAEVGKVIAAIEDLGLADEVALIVTTDHGMTPITTIVNVKRILHNHGIEAAALSSGTTSFVYLADPAQAQNAAARLSRYAEFEVVRREAQPGEWRIGKSARVGDLVISAHPPYFIEDLDTWPSWLRWLGDWGPEFLWAGLSLKATHGYVPSAAPVEGILYAWGSGIARGREVKSLNAVDVNPTVCSLLGIAPGTPVDGVVVKEMLQAP
jgi:predicted AlkP superfamily pyrophosphatase or phosphodiesterase